MRLEALTHDASDPQNLARFWGALLEAEVTADARGFLVGGSETQVGLRFRHDPSVKTGVSDVHLHVIREGVQAETVQRALDLGARHADVGQLPGERHVVLADPEGNEFCVIEPENNYLRGCGPLGELACDGLRHTGVFWSEALGWPLVWDQDEETAIQSPAGGTKVAWGGPPLELNPGRDRQRFELIGTVADIERLEQLGARRLAGNDFADPDGHEFAVVPEEA